MKKQRIAYLVLMFIFGVGIFLSACKDKEDDNFIWISQADQTSPTVTGSTPTDGSTNISVNSSVSYSFSKVMDIPSLTTNTSGTTCSGSIMVSADSFSSCVRMSGSPVASGDAKTFSVTPASPLSISAIYKARVTTSAIDLVGHSMANVSDSEIEFQTEEVIIVVGFRFNGSDRDWWIKKFDSNGNEDTVNWNKIYHGGSADDEARSVAADSNNNIYVVGYKFNGVDNDWWIKKFDINGTEDTTNWDKVLDSGAGLDIAYSVTIDSADNIYISGVNGFNNSDWWIKKFDTNGNEDTINWNKSFHGGFWDDAAYSITTDSNLNVYVAGKKATGATDTAMWLKKFSSSGIEDTLNWDKSLEYGVGYDIPYAIKAGSANNIYVAGFNQTGGNRAWWLQKFSDAGIEDTLNWEKTFAGSVQYDIANSLDFDSIGNVYIAGRLFNGSDLDWWLKKFDSNGNEDTTNWDRVIDGGNGVDDARSLAVGLNDNVYVVGNRHNGTDLDWWIKKFDSNGNEDTSNWNKIFAGTGGDDEAYAVLVLR